MYHKVDISQMRTESKKRNIFWDLKNSFSNKNCKSKAWSIDGLKDQEIKVTSINIIEIFFLCQDCRVFNFSSLLHFFII